MERKIKAVQYGVGKMSVYTMRYLLEKGVEIVGAIDMNPAVIGKDIGEIMGRENLGVTVTAVENAKQLLSDTKPDICVVMTRSLFGECEEAFMNAIQNGAKFGFPVTAFKQAGNSAAYRQGWVKNQMGLRGAYFIESDEEGLVEIKSDIPEIREDMVKVGMGTADIRYRGQFNNWYADLNITYNKNGQYSKEDIINIINAGGYICGAGEWRPERDGQFGMYHVQV